MARLEIKLKQHTPIIQFQGDQPGVILRGTEVKPKLDKFLIKYAFEDEFEDYKEYLVGYKKGITKKDYVDSKPLNYKIKIKVKTENKCKNMSYKNYPFYFSDIGKSQVNNGNKFIIYTDKIEQDAISKNEGKGRVIEGEIYIEFFSLYQELIDKIKEWIGGFFLVNNFGFRQNKGYGSFTVEKVDSNVNKIDYLNFINKIYTNKKNYYINYYKCGWMNIMKDCSTIYQIMKSGISFNKKEKSYLFEYMKKKNIADEKQFIINTIFNEKNNKNTIYRYERAVLGVCNFNDYKKLPDGKTGCKINYECDEIERYKSPILFKIIDNMLIVIAEEDDAIYDKTFNFKKENSEDGKEIKTPSKEEFDLEKFLESFFRYFNNNIEYFRTRHRLNFRGKIEVIK